MYQKTSFLFLIATILLGNGADQDLPKPIEPVEDTGWYAMDEELAYCIFETTDGRTIVEIPGLKTFKFKIWPQNGYLLELIEKKKKEDPHWINRQYFSQKETLLYMNFAALLQMNSTVDPTTKKAFQTILLKAGASPNIPDANGTTPLHICAQEKLDDAMQELLAYKGDPTVRDKEGNTPLHLLGLNAKLLQKAPLSLQTLKSMINHLLQHGADINARNNVGQTPLHILKNPIETLLNNGATQEEIVKIFQPLIPTMPAQHHVHLDTSLFGNKILRLCSSSKDTCSYSSTPIT